MQNDDTLQTAVAWMRAKRGRPAALSAATGIPVKVLRNLIYGETKDPSYRVVDALRAYFAANPPDAIDPGAAEPVHDDRSPA